MFTSNNGDRANVQNHVIIITDGASTLRVGQAVPNAINMRVAGIKISVIGVGLDANTLELRGVQFLTEFHDQTKLICFGNFVILSVSTIVSCHKTLFSCPNDILYHILLRLRIY